MASDQTLQPISITATRIPTDESVDTRDFRIESVALIAADGTSTDITALVGEIQVRQDIYLGFMSGDLIITDGIDLHSTLALHGGEYLLIAIKEPEQKVAINKAFRVYKVSDRIPVNNNAVRYSLYFVSDEFIHAKTERVSKAYRGSKISDIAKDIMTNVMGIPSSKQVIDDTNDPVDVVIPLMNPYEALQWLLTRAYSPDSSCWLFYENLDGFNFRSLNSIYKDSPPIKVPFVFENKIVAKSMGMDKYAMDSFKGRRDFDILQTLDDGGWAMSLLGLDPFHQTFKTNVYSIDETHKMYPNPSMTNAGDPNGNLLFDRHSAHVMTYIDTTDTSTEKASGTSKWVNRILSLSALNSNLVEIAIPGSMRVQVGKMISCRFPYSVTPSDAQNMWDKRKSSKYLVVAVNHKFDIVNSRFESIVLLARDSVPVALPACDVTLSSKIRNIT
jgi:hypothetical protein